MSQLQHTTRPASLVPAQERTAVLFAMVVTVAIIVALTATIAIVNRAPVAVSGAPATLGPADDYFFRHREAAAPITLTQQDDFWFRQQAAPAQLGPMDDYALRHSTRR